MRGPANPYIAGKSLRQVKGFYGRQDVFDLVRNEFDSPAQNAIVLFGQRRIGKTSILLQLKHRLPRPPFVPIYFDLMDRAHRALGEVLFELACAMASEVGIATPERAAFDNDGRFFRNGFLPCIYKQVEDGNRPILLFDEFDVLDQESERGLQDRAAAVAFFPFLRTLMETEQALGFVFVIGRKAADLSIGLKATFKAARYKKISVLDPDDARELILTAQRDGSLDFTEEAVHRVIELTSGHPFFTQLMCQLLWDAARKQKADRPRTDASDVDAMVSTAIEAGENFFEWIWDGLPPAERVIFATIARSTGEGATLTKEQLADILQGQGIRILSRELEIAPDTLVEWEMLRKRDGGYQFFIELMRRWVAERKPLDKVKEELYKINPLADSLYQSGYGYYRNGEGTQAIGLLRQTLANNPNHLKARLLLSQILVEQNKVGEALTELEQAYRYDPEAVHYQLVRVMLTLGEELERGGQTEEALAVYSRTLEISPAERTALQQRAAIWIGYGDAAIKSDRLTEAAEWYRKAGAPDKLSVTLERIRKQRLEALQADAKAAEQAENYTRAIEIYQQLLGEYPGEETLVQGLRNTQEMWDLERRYREGIAAIEQADWLQAQRALADVIFVRPNYKEAAESLMRAVQGERGPRAPAPAVRIPERAEAPPETVVPKVPENERDPGFTPKSNFASEPAIAPAPGSRSDGLTRMGHGAVISSVASAATLVAIAGVDGLVCVWDLRGHPVKKTKTMTHWRSARSVAFTPDGSLLAVGSTDGTIHVWSHFGTVAIPERVLEIRFRGAVTALEFSRTGEELAAGSSTGSIGLWSIPAGTQRAEVEAHLNGVTALSFSATEDPSRTARGPTKVFRVDESLPSGLPAGHLATAGDDGFVSIWNVELREVVRISHPASVTAVVLRNDGRVLATACEDRRVRIRNLKDGRASLDFLVTHKITALEFCGPLHIAAAGFDSKVHIWDLRTQKETGELVHPAAVSSLAFLPSLNSLVTGCEDGIGRIWEMASYLQGEKAAGRWAVS